MRRLARSNRHTVLVALGVLGTLTLLGACASDPAPPPPGGSPFCVTDCSPVGPGPVTPIEGDAGPTVSELTVTVDAPQFLVAQKASVDVGLTIARPAGMVEALALEVAGLPPGASATTLYVPHDQSKASFRVTIGATTPQGTHKFDVVLRGVTKSAGATVTLDVIGAPGVMDPSFGVGGRAIATGEDISVTTLLRQPDGKLVAVGAGSVTPTRDFAAVRFSADGAPDTTFGTAGRAVFDFGGDEHPYQAVVQPDGKIVSCGLQTSASAYVLLVSRWDAQGKPDTSFGNVATPNGKFTSAVTQYTACYGLTLLSDGKIVATGSTFNTVDHDLAMFKLTSAGLLDTAFGAPNGFITMQTGSTDYGFGVAVDGQGRLVTTGERYNGTAYDLLVARHLPTGAPDVSFGGGSTGWSSTVAGSAADPAYGWRILIQPDRKLLIGGQGPSGGGDYMLLRFDEAGTPDTTFGTAGKVVVHRGTPDRLFQIRLDAQGRILFSGNTGSGAAAKGVVGRLNANGTVDTSFGTNGTTTFDFSAADVDSAAGLEIAPDGRILVSGSSAEAGKNVPWIVRLWP